MIISCPECKKRFMIDDSKAQSRGLRFRCSGCNAIFGVSQETGGAKAASVDCACRVLVANEDTGVLDSVEEVLRGRNIDVLRTSDGVEALEMVKRMRPSLAILDVALPGLYGFIVCERIKNDPELKGTKVMLTTSVYDKTRYKRRPTSLYGADEYMEMHSIHEELVEKMGRLITLPGPQAGPGETAPQAAQRPAANATGHTVAGKNTDKAGGDEKAREQDDKTRDKALRLARIIVADLFLYHRKTHDGEINRGNYYKVFKSEIEEGVKYFNKRMPPSGPAAAYQAEAYLKEAFEEYLSKKELEKKAV